MSFLSVTFHSNLLSLAAGLSVGETFERMTPVRKFRSNERHLPRPQAVGNDTGERDSDVAANKNLPGGANSS